MEENELYHYGVLGMKWGVRKNPSKAYRKSTTKADKLDRKATNYSVASAKATIKSAKQKNKVAKARARIERDSDFAPNMKKFAKMENRSRAYEQQSNKLAIKSAKAKKRSVKWEQQMRKAFSNVNIKDILPEDLARGRRYVDMLVRD